MASGIGAFGGTSQCYRFWLGFTECRVRERCQTPKKFALRSLCAFSLAAARLESHALLAGAGRLHGVLAPR